MNWQASLYGQKFATLRRATPSAPGLRFTRDVTLQQSPRQLFPNLSVNHTTKVIESGKTKDENDDW